MASSILKNFVTNQMPSIVKKDIFRHGLRNGQASRRLLHKRELVFKLNDHERPRGNLTWKNSNIHGKLLGRFFSFRGF